MISEKNKTMVIGLTGGLGTGKTTVAKVFKSLGAFVLDADKIAHSAFNTRTSSHKKVVRLFGRGVLDKSGRIDRAKLGGIVFSDKKLLDKLCGIIHPIVIAEVKRYIKEISRSRKTRVAVIDAPLLIEAGLDKIADHLIVVKASRATQLKRAMKRSGLKANEIICRMKCQMPLGEKIKMAHYVIDNNKNLSNTKKQVRKIWREVQGG